MSTIAKDDYPIDFHDLTNTSSLGVRTPEAFFCPVALFQPSQNLMRKYPNLSLPFASLMGM